jgi:HlyD family secretion protein
MKKILIAGAAVIVVVAAGAGFLFFRSKGNGPQYRTEKAVRGDIVTSVTATGTMNAVTTVLVGTQVSGTIKHLYVDFNSYVKKGQLIAQVDPALFEEQVQQQKANLLSAKANLEKSEASLVDAKRTRDRNAELLSKGLIARSDFDTADTNHETAKAQVSASKAQVAQADAALKNAQTNLGYTKILSPVDGTVVSRSVDVGQTVAASFQTPTLFTIAQDLTKMQIDTSVDEADIGKILVGQEVDFTVDAYPDVTFRGRVSQVRIAPIIVQNVVTYDVVVKVENPDLRLKPGMTANVSIIVSAKKDVLKVPNAALRFRLPETEKTKAAQKGPGGAQKGPGAGQKGSAAWVLEAGKPKRVAVTPGISDGAYTEVISGEIREGQEVIVESLAKPKGDTSPARAPRFF